MNRAPADLAAGIRPRTGTTEFSVDKSDDSGGGFNIDEYRDFGEDDEHFGTALHCAVYHNQVLFKGSRVA